MQQIENQKSLYIISKNYGPKWFGPKWFGPKWLWVEMVMGRNGYGPKGPGTDTVHVQTVSCCLQGLWLHNGTCAKLQPLNLNVVLQFFGSIAIYAAYCFLYAIFYIFNWILRRIFLNEQQMDKPKAQFGRILYKRKLHWLAYASTGDFLCLYSSSVNPEYVLKPTVSLYALSKDEAVFVETNADIDIFSSDTNPFLCYGQFDHCVNVIKMPIRTTSMLWLKRLETLQYQ